MNHNLDELASVADLPAFYDPEACQPAGDLTVACYVFPHFNVTGLNQEIYGGGWTEHVLRQAARPWFPGHRQPRSPLWGEQDEADPLVMARQIDLAADYGVDAFIYDWYWYGGRPALHEGLEQGFLRAANRERVKFAVMWCPHDWPIWTLDMLTDGTLNRPIVRPGPETAADVRRSFSYLMSRYFHEPNYWRIEEKPVVVIWELARLERLFGQTGVRSFLDELRAEAGRLGHAGIHFHASSAASASLIDHFATAGFDSYGDYNTIVSVHRAVAAGQPTVSYARCAADVVRRHWAEREAASPLPYFPNVGVGWDHTPRHRAPDCWPPPADWPGLPIVVDDTPAAFEALLKASMGYINTRVVGPKILTLGCWNEWTEGHYLLPDTDRGMGMLYALARARGRR
ncbi:MAG: glycoside hydrolase family 99-like domain-containing protein [Anaerolineae bacterium]